MSIMASQNPIVPYTALMCKWVNLISPAHEPHGQWFACMREKYVIALPLKIALNLDRILTSGSCIYKCNEIDWPQILFSLLYICTEDCDLLDLKLFPILSILLHITLYILLKMDTSYLNQIINNEAFSNYMNQCRTIARPSE